MTLLSFTIASAACAAIPAVLTLWNYAEYRAPRSATGCDEALTVIIPARNEEQGIEACVRSVLASVGVALTVLVIDDASTDGTADVVQRVAAQDARVRLIRNEALPAGWNGKQHACFVGARLAQSPLFCFLDADVRLQPEALVRLAAQMRRDGAALISGFPRELTGGVLDRLLIPLIHFVLLGFLPMRFLRTGVSPGFAAGCGQLLMVDRTAYFAAGAHEAIRSTMHDGLLLPRLLRQHGYPTRLVDLTHLATCRMYTADAATWNGLSKNATEGIAAPARIVPFTLLLLLGQVLPLPLLVIAWERTTFVIPFLGPPIRVGMQPVWVALFAVGLSYLPRVMHAARFRQSAVGAVLHPVGVLVLLVLQWVALVRKVLRRPATWKARSYGQ